MAGTNKKCMQPTADMRDRCSCALDYMITFERPSESGSHTCVFNCSKLNYYACTPSSRFQIKSEALHYHYYAFIKIFLLYKLLEHNKEQRKASVAHFFNAVQKKCVLANLAAVAGLLVLNAGSLLNCWTECILRHDHHAFWDS